MRATILKVAHHQLALLDNLGRVFTTTEHNLDTNNQAEFYHTKLTLDIEGNLLEVLDANKHIATTDTYAAGLADTEGEQLCGLEAGSMIVGTPDYMAPEMFLGDAQRLSPRTDVYLLGGILYALLAGRPPRSESSIEAALRSALRADIALPSEVPGPLAQLCERAPHSTPSILRKTICGESRSEWRMP